MKKEVTCSNSTLFVVRLITKMLSIHCGKAEILSYTLKDSKLWGEVEVLENQGRSFRKRKLKFKAKIPLTPDGQVDRSGGFELDADYEAFGIHSFTGYLCDDPQYVKIVDRRTDVALCVIGSSETNWRIETFNGTPPVILYDI